VLSGMESDGTSCSASMLFLDPLALKFFDDLLL